MTPDDEIWAPYWISSHLGGGFKYFFIFTPNLGEDEPILTIIFFKRVETTNQFLFSFPKPQLYVDLLRGEGWMEGASVFSFCWEN